MQVERAVLRDRAKTDFYIKYAQGKTMMQLNYRADALYKMICYDRYFMHFGIKSIQGTNIPINEVSFAPTIHVFAF